MYQQRQRKLYQKKEKGESAMSKEPLCPTVGTIIRSRRLELGFTQEKVATAAGWTRGEMVSLVESGHRIANLDRIPALANGLILDPAALCKFALAARYPAFYKALFGCTAPEAPGSAEVKNG
jgi:transcriptional regulator with XRE-family HTH domain